MSRHQDRKKKALFAEEEAGGAAHGMLTRHQDKRRDVTAHSEQSTHASSVSLHPYTL